MIKQIADKTIGQEKAVRCIACGGDGNLSRVPHLLDHDVLEQAIHREPLGWRIVHNHNPSQLVVR